MLTPVSASAPGAGQLGRAPTSYFAPDNIFAVGSEPGAACAELKRVICGLHDAGIEVILQVCHLCSSCEWHLSARLLTDLRK
jgi:hypothetical protein